MTTLTEFGLGFPRAGVLRTLRTALVNGKTAEECIERIVPDQGHCHGKSA